jgi:ribosomal protein S12 methylthiotransferase
MPTNLSALEALDRLRAGVPDLFLRTSLIVGFPGETRAAFDRLLRFVDGARWDYLGVFPYSREEGTPAFRMPSQVPERTKEERARRVRDAQADLLAARNVSRIGQTLEVLVEKTGARGKAVGRFPGMAADGQKTGLGNRAVQFFAERQHRPA